MGILVWLLIGGIVGWLASLIMGTDARQGCILNVVVGIIGAVIAGLVFGGGASINNYLSIKSLALSTLGAIVLLAVVNLIRRGTVR